MLWELWIQFCREASQRSASHCESTVQRWRKANTKVKKCNYKSYDCYEYDEYDAYDDYYGYNEYGECSEYGGYDKY